MKRSNLQKTMTTWILWHSTNTDWAATDFYNFLPISDTGRLFGSLTSPYNEVYTLQYQKQGGIV